MTEIGTDIVEVSRVVDACYHYLPEVRKEFISKYFTAAEIAEGESRAGREYYFAGRWAAKEAIIKCLGKSTKPLDIEIINNTEGKPVVTIKDSKYLSVKISISHCREYATAVALVSISDYYRNHD